MKDIARKIVAFLFRILPYGAQEILFYEYVKSRGEDSIISNFLHLLNIASIKVNGKFGVIEGATEDVSVIRVYGRESTWGDRTNEIIKQFFVREGGGVYLDIGANIGLTTIPIAADPNIKCIAFEPDPINFRFLENNVAANCIHGNVTLHNIALFNREEKLKMEISSSNFGDHRLRLGEAFALMKENERPTVWVSARSLDEIDLGLSSPIAVKIDTQGAEPFVVEGGWQALSQARLIIMEFSPYQMERMGGSLEVVLDLVRTFPFVQIAKGESALPSYQMSGEDAVCQLHMLYGQNKQTPFGAYWDIIATRDRAQME